MAGQIWKNNALGCETAASVANMRCYGPLRMKDGRTVYRYYGRELKNDKGLTVFEAHYAQLDPGSFKALFEPSP